MNPRAHLCALGVALAAVAVTGACGGPSASTTSTTASTSSVTSSAAPASTSATSSTTSSPSATAPSTLPSSTSGGGISPAATATVGTDELCSSLRSADFRPTDLTTLPAGSVQDTVGEVVERQERLASVLTPPGLTEDWQTTLGAFDAIAQRVSDAGKDSAVPGIVRAELAKVAPARDRVLQATAACRRP
ncbi:hypothetical protein [uncultured Arsenicicoccus sp.]|uniref:hypothetical protein n=1 Tax=uncultured Arsenicicoccus sp. TaxID=491339 RepID=UPI00259760DD|nr:hypothetical protein [uncultured Arsenicicoccus sp.]